MTKARRKRDKRYYCGKLISLQREEIEQELAGITPIAHDTRRLLSFEGFVDYFLRMRHLYPTYWEAYEQLEEYYTAITGHRRYSEYNAFRKVMERRYR